MDDLLALIQKYGVDAVFFIIMVGGYKRIWVWRQECEKTERLLREQLTKEESEKQEWKRISMRLIYSLQIEDRGSGPMIHSERNVDDGS